MKSKNVKNDPKKQNSNWEPAYKVNKSNKGYIINKSVKYDSTVKIWSSVIVIVIILAIFTLLYTIFKDNEFVKNLITVSDSYIFIGLTTFIIFLVFKRNKKEYNNSRKGVGKNARQR